MLQHSRLSRARLESRFPLPAGAFLALCFCFGLAAPADARPEMAGQNAASRFTAMDANRDGTLVREEFFSAQPQMKEGAFAAIDAVQDGGISLQEWERFFSGHGKGVSPAGQDMPPAARKQPGRAQPDKTPELILPPAGTK